jgi:hypothetical protein
VSAEDALRRARLEFGSQERIQEQCREARDIRLAHELIADVRLTWRQVRRDRGLSATILTTLTLAFGVTASVFAVVNAVMLDPLPYRKSNLRPWTWVAPHVRRLPRSLHLPVAVVDGSLSRNLNKTSVWLWT